MLGRFATILTITSALVTGMSYAHAEGQIRIVEQFGTVYLPLHVIRDQKLIEKHGKAAGIDIKVDWTKLSGGAAINDALLAGAVDIGAAGAGPVIVLWDRTRGTADVKIIAALGEQPNYLITNNPNIKTLKDFTKADKIALPAVVVSQQSRLLQIAAEKEFGEGKFNALDDITVSLPHPDATAALLAGSSTITAHFSNPPFQEQALKNPSVHKVLSSYDIMGGKITPTLLYATSKFRAENPKTFKALFDALTEASQWIEANKAEAAKTYIRVEQSKLDPAFIQSVIDNKDVSFTTTPKGTFTYQLHEIVPVLEAVNQKYALKPRRWVIEHIGRARDEDILALARLGVFVTTIPTYYLWKGGEKYLGDADGGSHVVPHRRLLDAGIPVAMATDNIPYDPFFTLWVACAREERVSGRVLREDQCLDAFTALRLFTTAGAFLTFDESWKGPLKVGFAADIAVLSNNPTDVSIAELKDLECLMTLVGGRIVHNSL